jgi:hypothetical protein
MKAGGEVVIHPRFQRIYQPDLGAILHREAEQLRAAKYNLPVESAVTILWTGTDGPVVTGEYAVPGGETIHYTVARMWEKDPDTMFDIPMAAILSPLAGFGPERLPEVLRRMDEAIESHARNEQERENYWVIAYTNVGLRFPAERVHELLAHRMEYIWSLNPMRRTRSNGHSRALAETLPEGDLRATWQWVLALGRERLGEPPAEVPGALAAITNLDRLEQLASRVLKAATWLEALAPG